MFSSDPLPLRLQITGSLLELEPLTSLDLVLSTWLEDMLRLLAAGLLAHESADSSLMEL